MGQAQGFRTRRKEPILSMAECAAKTEQESPDLPSAHGGDWNWSRQPAQGGRRTTLEGLKAQFGGRPEAHGVQAAAYVYGIPVAELMGWKGDAEGSKPA